MKWTLGVMLVAGFAALSGGGALYGQVATGKSKPIATMPGSDQMRRTLPQPVGRPPSWSDIEQEFEARRKQRKEWGVGHELVASYYEFLASPQASGSKTLAEHLEHLARWRQQQPNSITARLVTARALIHYGWEARGSGWAGTVTAEGWKLFDERVADAHRLVERAIAMGVEDAEAYTLLVKLGYAEGHPREQVQQWLKAGMKLDPTYYQLYKEMAVYLLPRWMGEPGDIEEFAADVARTLPGDNGLEAFARIALEVQHYEGGGGQTLLRGGYDHETLVRSAEVLLKRHPALPVVAHFAALCSVVAQDHEAAIRIRPFVGPFNAEDKIWAWENSLKLFREWSAAAESPRGEERWLFAGLTGCPGIAFGENAGQMWVAQQLGTSAVNLMDVTSGQVVLPLPHPGGVVNEMAVDSTRRWVVASAWQGPLTGWMLWDFGRGEPVTHETKEQCRALEIHPQRPMVFWAEGMKVLSWDVKTDEAGPEIDVKEHVHRMCFSPDGSLLAVNSVVCDVEAGKVKYKLPIAEPGKQPKIFVHKIVAIDEEGRAWATAMTPNGKMILARFSDDGKTWETLLEDIGEGSAWLSPDRKLLVVVSQRQAVSGGVSRIDVWNVAKGKRVKQFDGHWNLIQKLAFSPDGSKLASVAMWADVVKIWPLEGLAD
jgi:Domain of unknown function (DUF4034)/WD domain, G-beta repeat